ncbi:MAG TPA: substrate-binding domain-containing protein [Lachnospiraceae bacterium]|nr:substrate-binding domain-containing protein [Lachnospiraceae bacterium]
MKKIWITLIVLMLSTLLYACGKKEDSTNAIPEDTQTQENAMDTQENVTNAKEQDIDTENDVQSETVKGKIILATTTSTQDSGLLDSLLPKFKAETGWEVDTVAVGTGEALKMGESGEADVLLVHAKAKEEAFIEAGYGLERYDVMYNDFVVVGPSNLIEKNEDVLKTFKEIYDKKYGFISRGDESGTHTKELGIWSELGVTPTDNNGYINAGQGMSATILMADEKEAYTLTDRATWLTTKEKTSMDIICEKDPLLLNYYGVIAVNPELNDKINAKGAQAFLDWILSDKTQEFIGTFGVKEYNEPLFIPNATENK